MDREEPEVPLTFFLLYSCWVGYSDALTSLVCHHVPAAFDYVRVLYHKVEDCLQACLSRLVFLFV